MTHGKGLSPDEILNLLRELSENELDGGKLSCPDLDSDEDASLSESDCQVSEERYQIKLIIFYYTRAFGNRSRNFEPWSSDVDDT
ncbi:hypothetical protein TNCV_3120471 [Trichonephila clavipes]|uniref:Uncharacterized protein n=1 Tax=Trichonephila clavipes TaxID=2585209 RepID=A0A8X7BHT8_TRICX|nr:hypothetical protein TNCV_3120471 [Trichonephila clavipes]